VEDVRTNATAAAFDDPRFASMTREEYGDLAVEVSVLSPSTALIAFSEQSLLEQLRPGVDGVTLQLGDCRGTFLPQVWESLPDPREFVAHLKRKAGLPLEFWSQELAVSRYTVEKFAEAQAA
jgi:AmmeMemoRadiSam system protein A